MMKPDAPTILFVREVPWRTHFPITTRVLAGDFAADGWNVLWITTPLPPWNTGRGVRGDALREQHDSGGLWVEENVFAYTPQTRIPFSRHFPLDRAFLARRIWDGCQPPLHEVLDAAGVPAPDVLFLAHWGAGALRHLFPGVPVVFHVTDNYAHYPAVPAAACDRLQRENYRAADHVIVTAYSLETLLMRRFGVPRAKISVVTHGVDLAQYDPMLPDPLPEVAKPRAVLLGNTRKLDYPLLAGLADALPEMAFVVIGPPCDDLHAVARHRPNVVVVGAVMPEDVPAYLVHAEVGLVLLGVRYRAAGADMSPMKLFEYAAAGLPVLGQPLPVYDALHVPGLTFTDVLTGRSAIRRALAGRPAWRDAARAFAARHTRARKFATVRDLVRAVIARHRGVPIPETSVEAV